MAVYIEYYTAQLSWYIWEMILPWSQKHLGLRPLLGYLRYLLMFIGEKRINKWISNNHKPKDCPVFHTRLKKKRPGWFSGTDGLNSITFLNSMMFSNFLRNFTLTRTKKHIYNFITRTKIYNNKKCQMKKFDKNLLGITYQEDNQNEIN